MSFMETLKKAIVNEIGKYRYYLIALAWIMLMVFFTYTAILSEAMMAGKSLEDVHWANQCTMISLIVNCGLLFMVVFDYMLAGKQISHTMMWLIFLDIILAIGIYGHTRILEDNALDNYKYPLSWSSLSLCLHLAFLIILLWLKERAIEQDMSEVVIVSEI